MTKALNIAQFITPIVILGCGKASYNQGTDGWDTGVDTGTDTTDTSDTDTTDTDTDTDTDTTTVELGDCGNMWDPVDITGWTKSFTVVEDGIYGTGSMSGSGQTWDGAGYEVYQVEDSVSLDSGEGYNMSVYFSCDLNGEPGLFITGWEGSYSGDSGPMNIQGTDNPGRKYLPAADEIGNIGSWTYSYDLQLLSDGTDLGAVATSGTYVELGMVDVEIGGTTYSGYRLTNTYHMEFGGFSGMGEFIRDGYIDQIWVQGLGLVSEQHDSSFDDGSSSSMTKTLDSFTGLTPIQ